MNPASLKSLKFPMPALVAALALLAVAALSGATPLLAADQPAIFPLDQIKPGMTGTASTIFDGAGIEKFDFSVIGVMPNLLGPKQSVILVQLHGPKVEHTGVVAGMSGSPCYIDGKLVGALSLKMGVFSKEAIAGITPIEEMFSLPSGKDIQPIGTPTNQARAASEGTPTVSLADTATLHLTPASDAFGGAPHYALPTSFAQSSGMAAGAYMEPIAAPLSFTGFNPATIQKYASTWLPYGLEAAAGGSGTPEPDDAKLVAGDMVSMVLVSGDLSLDAGCTVTAIIDNRVYACGHPLFGSGNSRLPLARGRVVTTLASDFESTKLMTTGGLIGTLTEDRATAVMGRLGASPALIPVDLTVVTPEGEKQIHVQVISDPKLTPVLVGLISFNGLTQNPVYADGTTMRLSGTININGHDPVSIENMYAPGDVFVPDGQFVATSFQQIFSRIFSNPYETPEISRVSLKVESVPDRRVATIENAWSDTSEANPGQNVSVKVMLRPYRGAPVIEDVPVTIPEQAAHGSTLRILVSDSDSLNRVSNLLAAQGRLGSLDQLVALLNRQRHNNRVYVSIFKPTPTLLVEDKELPDAPLSEINVLDQGRVAETSALLRESEVGEWSVSTDEVIAGSQSVLIKIK